MIQNTMDQSAYALIWTAGLLEGEGSFVVTKKGSVLICCEMTDADVVYRLLQWGGSVRENGRRRENWKETYSWRLSGQPAIELAKELQPFMGVRRDAQISRLIEAGEAMAKSKEDFKNSVAHKREQAKRLRKDLKMTHQQIADTLGIDRTYVSHILGGRYDDQDNRKAGP